MPRDTFTNEYERLSFDVNVALMGYADETQSMKKARKEGDRITTRADAESIIEQARADVYDMEEERKRRA